MEIPNYSGENMLVGANSLYIRAKNFVELYERNPSIPPDVLFTLREYLNDINRYIRDISAYNFAPRSDNLTKEGILIDLENMKVRIYGLSPPNNNISTGGRRRKSRKSRRSRRSRKHRSRRHR